MWRETSLKDNPDFILLKWEVFEISLNGVTSRHFIGDDILTQSPKVSAPIIRFDHEKMLGKTKNSTIFRLLKTPSGRSDARDIIYTWLIDSGFYCDDVSIISGTLVTPI